MVDQRESEGRQRAKDAPSPHGPRRDPGETTKAISGLLAARKALLDRPAGRATVAFPDVSRSLGEIIRRSKDLKDQRSEPEGSSISLDSPPVNLPDAGPSDGSSHIDHLRAERQGIVSSKGEQAAAPIGDNGGSISAGRGVSSALPPAPLVVGSSRVAPESSKPEPVLDPRITSEAAKLVAGGGSFALDGASEHGHQFGQSLAAGPAHRSDPTGVVGEGPYPAQKQGSFSYKAAVGDLPREGPGVKTSRETSDFPGHQGFGAGASSPGVTPGNDPNPADPARSPSTFVRNPLSSELRSLSLASSAPTGETSRSSDRDGKGRGSLEDSFGQAASSQGAASIDLSKTNELLQQLIDAVRKQRGSSLPVGGPSVYSDR